MEYEKLQQAPAERTQANLEYRLNRSTDETTIFIGSIL